MFGRDGPVIGVVGGSGGVGTSTFAAVLAAECRGSVLVDLDVDGGGIDVTLGIEGAPGARWSGLRLAGGGLARSALVDGLPSWHDCAVLAADVASLAPADVGQVIDVARTGGPVVLDLARADSAWRAEAVLRCSLVVVLARADVAGLTAAHAVAAALGDPPKGVVVRRGDVAADDAAGAIGARLLGEMPPVRRPVHAGRAPRAVVRLALGVLAGLADPVVPA